MAAKHHESADAPLSFYYLDSDNDQIDLSEDEDLLEAARYRKMKGLVNLEVNAAAVGRKGNAPRADSREQAEETKAERRSQGSVLSVNNSERKGVGAEEAMREQVRRQVMESLTGKQAEEPRRESVDI